MNFDTPVVVGLHAERPDSPPGLADARWVRAECDECGKVGYTVEDAVDDARGKFGPVRGLRCRECDAPDAELVTDGGEDADEIATGVSEDSDVNAPDAVAFGYADDGEYAVTWAVYPPHDGEYHVDVFNFEAGAVAHVHEFTVDTDGVDSAEALASALATKAPKDALEAARAYWGDGAETDGGEWDEGAALESLSKGELRRLTQHTDEAYDRLRKAYDILKRNGVLGEWYDESGDYGTLYSLTDALSQVGDAHADFKSAYERRRAEGSEIETDGGRDVDDIAELSQGEVVEFAYDSTEDGSLVVEEGVVCKANSGGARILVDGPRYSARNLRVIRTTGLVLSTSQAGGLTRDRIGRAATVRRTGETRAVEYDQHSGWIHAE